MVNVPYYLYKIQNILKIKTYIVLIVSDRDYGFIVLFNKMSLINKMPPSLLTSKITSLNSSVTFLGIIIICRIGCKTNGVRQKRSMIDSHVDWAEYTFNFPSACPLTIHMKTWKGETLKLIYKQKLIVLQVLLGKG